MSEAPGTSDMAKENTTLRPPEIEAKLEEYGVDPRIVAVLRSAWSDKRIANRGNAKAYVGIGAPGSRIAAYVGRNQFTLRLNAEDSQRLVGRYPSLEIQTESEELYVIVRASALDDQDVRAAVAEHLEIALTLSVEKQIESDHQANRVVVAVPQPYCAECGLNHAGEH